MSDTASPSLDSRALLLRALAAGFASPDSAWRERFLRLLEESGGANALGQALEESRLDALQADNFRLFGPAAECPLELALHLSDSPFEQARIMAEMAGFHRAFGVQSTSGVRPDGLPVCLEFFAYLCLKENQAPGVEAAEVTRKALQDFRRDFLLPGLSAFLERMRRLTDNRFYILLAEIALEEVRRCDSSS